MKTRWNSPPSLDVGDKAMFATHHGAEMLVVTVQDDLERVLELNLDIHAARELLRALSWALRRKDVASA